VSGLVVINSFDLQSRVWGFNSYLFELFCGSSRQWHIIRTYVHGSVTEQHNLLGHLPKGSDVQQLEW